MKRFKEFLFEMEHLPYFITNEFGKYIDMNAAARQRRAGNITYQDDKRYKDHEGALWLDVKHKDYYTIAAAALTGMADAKRFNVSENIDVITSSRQNINVFLKNNENIRELVNKIWNFLKQYMSKGVITVYRGIDIPESIDKLVKSNPYALHNPSRILQYIDNTTKEFNSFSVSKEIAEEFAKLDLKRNRINYILFSAEVDNNDINWAFTAYLDGRHGGIEEYELNINNLKRLKNVKLLDYYIDDLAHDGLTENKCIKYLKSCEQQFCNILSQTPELIDAACKKLEINYNVNNNIPIKLSCKYELSIGNWNACRVYCIDKRNNDDVCTRYYAYNTLTKQLVSGSAIWTRGKCLILTINEDEQQIFVKDKYLTTICCIDSKICDDAIHDDIWTVILTNGETATFNFTTNKFVS